jgi:serine/threonine-protein kinase RsbW
LDTAEIRPLRRDEVEVRMVAARGRVPGLRALAADLALREDYDLDAVDDLRLVIDEICAILIADAASGAVMTVRLRIGPDRIEIGATVALPGLGEPAVLPLSVRILETLSDEFDYVAVGDGMDRVLRLSFVRARGRTASA